MKSWYILGTFLSGIGILFSILADSVGMVIVSLIAMVLFIIMTNFEAKKNTDIRKQEAIKQIENKLKENNIIKSQFYLNDNQTNGLVLDEKNKQIVVIHKQPNDYLLTPYSFSKIIESEIREDGNSVIKTSRGSQLGGALVGGALAGGTGAIIGGLSGSKTSADKTKRITLNIVVDELSTPYEAITFMDVGNYLDKDSPYYKSQSEKAFHWHKMLSVIIKRQENNNADQSVSSSH